LREAKKDGRNAGVKVRGGKITGKGSLNGWHRGGGSSEGINTWKRQYRKLSRCKQIKHGGKEKKQVGVVRAGDGSFGKKK